MQLDLTDLIKLLVRQILGMTQATVDMLESENPLTLEADVYERLAADFKLKAEFLRQTASIDVAAK